MVISREKEGRYTLEGVHKWASQSPAMFYSPSCAVVTSAGFYKLSGMWYILQ